METAEGNIFVYMIVYTHKIIHTHIHTYLPTYINTEAAPYTSVFQEIKKM